MTPRQIAMILLQTQTDEASARKLLDQYSDADLVKPMASKQGAVLFVRNLIGIQS